MLKRSRIRVPGYLSLREEARVMQRLTDTGAKHALQILKDLTNKGPRLEFPASLP